MNTNPLPIPTSNAVKATLTIPSSKSISNRALLLAALAKGTSKLTNVLVCDDTHYMQQALQKLGVTIIKKENQHIIHGLGGAFTSHTHPLYIENAGTASRFLTAALNLGKGEYVLTGNDRMQQRPIKDLTIALQQLGCKITHINKTESLPLQIQANGIQGGQVTLYAEHSSQYISALLMCAPYAHKDIRISLEGNIVSKTYIDMTLELMKNFGVTVSWLSASSLVIKANQAYQAQEYTVETDASTASYFLALPAIVGGSITLNGFSPYSTQGDWGFAKILEQMGCLVERTDSTITVSKPTNRLQSVAIDMNTMSDVAPTLASVALFATGKTTIYNIANMRLKECDRIDAIATELTKLGAICEQTPSSLTITPSDSYNPVSFNTYDDHRMAMSFALIAAKVKGCSIKHPACVSKTFPHFFETFLPLLTTT